jgi:hypothetical protein
MICEEDEDNHGFLRIITKEVITAMIYESTFKVDMLEIRPSLESARTMIVLCLSKGGEMYPISGFPRHLQSDVMQNRRPRMKDGPAASGRHSRDNLAEGDHSMDPATLNLRAESSSSNETLSSLGADEDVPFWARGFRRSFPGSIDEIVEPPDTSTSTETATTTYDDSSHESCRDPSDNKSSIQPSQDERFTQRPQIGGKVTKSDSRVYQSSLKGKMRAGDVLHRPRSLENLSSHAAFASEAELATNPVTDLNSNMGEQNLVQGPGLIGIIDGMTEEKMLELAKQESLKTARVTTSPNITLEPLETRLASRSHSDGHSSWVSSRGFQNVAYPIPGSVKSDQQSLQEIEEPPAIVTNMTEEEIYQIAKMRSMELH